MFYVSGQYRASKTSKAKSYMPSQDRPNREEDNLRVQVDWLCFVIYLNCFKWLATNDATRL